MNKNIVVVAVIVILILIVGGIYLLAGSPGGLIGGSKSFNIQGMKVEIVKNGTGEGAKVGDNILVNYVGTLTDGKKFDSSFDRNQPFPYTLGQNRVIKGWELGLVGMKVGEQRKLTIPPELGYGAQGAGAVIPPNSTLIFVIDMVSINK
ncbi:MAG: FKBP-type peptidyl-prolyl cis-trans isomerase [Candidatus Staskawiczbacteria bacterium]|nr:FKBP-type peptidyl-prolyl cis-trans isomerase [Candidatus Staskawiczbacteria bacterium]